MSTYRTSAAGASPRATRWPRVPAGRATPVRSRKFSAFVARPSYARPAVGEHRRDARAAGVPRARRGRRARSRPTSTGHRRRSSRTRCAYGPRRPASSSGWQQIHASQSPSDRRVLDSDHRVLHTNPRVAREHHAAVAPANASGEAASSSAIHQWRLPGVAQQHVQPPAPARHADQGGALERRGAERSLRDPRHRREPLAVVATARRPPRRRAAPYAGPGRRRRTTRRRSSTALGAPVHSPGPRPGAGAATATRPVPGSGRTAAASPACAAAAPSARRRPAADANSHGAALHIARNQGPNCVSSRHPAAARDDETTPRRRRVVP